MSQHAFHVEIEGIAPLIQNNPAKALDEMCKNKKTRKTAAEVPSDEWRTKVYHFEDGKTLGHPCEAIEYALQEAAKSFKAKGRGSLTKLLDSLPGLFPVAWSPRICLCSLPDGVCNLFSCSLRMKFSVWRI